MKLITCVIRPEKLDSITNSLDKMHVTGMTVTDVRGFGRQRGQVEHYMGVEYTIRFLPKVKIDLVVQDDAVDNVMSGIAEIARTGKVGDGKIFVQEVPAAMRIRTGERDASAI